MMSANNWTDKVAFDNFGLALKGEANTWLDSQVILIFRAACHFSTQDTTFHFPEWNQSKSH
jgi:hypothetical protein